MEKRDFRPVRKTFPVNTLIEGRRVLVVGGGRVGQRKIELLLDADAQVVLVCPDCVSELVQMADAGRITYQARRFEVSDIEGASLVFACTDDKHVNRQILNLSKQAKVPCCCADGNWPDGDFVTPAIIRAGEVLIAVSTSGRSCVQSRLVKDNLRKHLDSIESSDLLVLGTSHAYLGMAERAPYHLLLREREELGEMIRQVWGVHEFLILNTCNRVEIIAAISKEAGTSGILRRLMRFDRLSSDLFYMKHGFDAFAHVCKVTAGMDSQVPGEVHVVAQLKDAIDESVTRGWAGSLIRGLCDSALRVSKEVRAELGTLLEVSEIEDVALRYLDAKKVQQGTALVIGSGVVGRGVMKGLLERGFTCIWAYHANKPEAEKGVQVVQLDQLPEVLPLADVVLSAVDTQVPVVTAAAHQQVLNPDGVFFIDIGIPRNIDPAFDACGGNIRVADLDELKRWFREQNGSFDRANAICDRVLNANRESYERIIKSLRGE
jgi:precorrin-2 dehydrogenase/sirohydrochlorin ferrochelatase